MLEPSVSLGLFRTLLLACLYAVGVHAQFNQFTTVKNGVPLWTPKPVANPASVVSVSSTSAGAQPTLVWNCQQMPSICTNVYNYLKNNGGNGDLYGPTELVYDLDSARKDKRRDAMCDSGASKPWGQHVCPDTNLPVMNSLYPPLPAGYDQNFYYSHVGVTKPKTGNQWMIPGFKDSNGNYVPSGLLYTCDEYDSIFLMRLVSCPCRASSVVCLPASSVVYQTII